MAIKLNAKAAGATVGGVGGAAAATKFCGALTVLTIFYLDLEPSTPQPVVDAWNDVFTAIYWVAITAVVTAITWLLSPKSRAKPATPAEAPQPPATPAKEGKGSNAQIVPGA
jgi:hypothetical protein